MCAGNNKFELHMDGLEFGDYCIASQYGDMSIYDPWAIGYLRSVIISDAGKIRYMLSGEDVPPRWYSHCKKITPEDAKQWLLWRDKS